MKDIGQGHQKGMAEVLIKVGSSSIFDMCVCPRSVQLEVFKINPGFNLHGEKEEIDFENFSNEVNYNH